MARGGDAGQNSKSHHADDADAYPSWGHMKQVCSHRQTDDKHDISDDVHPE